MAQSLCGCCVSLHVAGCFTALMASSKDQSVSNEGELEVLEPTCSSGDAGTTLVLLSTALAATLLPLTALLCRTLASGLPCGGNLHLLCKLLVDICLDCMFAVLGFAQGRVHGLRL